MKKQWQKIVCIGLALITIILTASACPSPGGQNGVPLVDIIRVAPNNLNLAGSTEAVIATPAEGALLVNQDLRLWVPPGAVTQDTPVTITLCTELPEIIAPTDADAPQVNIISELYDLGPDNTTFNTPVKITIPYAEAALPAGTDETTIGIVYFDGQNWVAIQPYVDTVNNTLTFETKAFPGFLLAAFLPTNPVGWVIVGGLAIVSVVAWSRGGPNIESQIVKDPIYYGKAGNYITPDDPVVKKNAELAVIDLKGNDNKHIILKDLMGNPAALAEFVSHGGGMIGFNNGTTTSYVKYETIEDPRDWQMPNDYFNNGMIGDCKNVANGMASIFRSYGYPVKCVDGLASGGRHVWAEVSIDGKPYYVGEDGDIMPLDEAITLLHLTRPQGVDGQNQMWDENGQKPYKENWWQQLEVTIDKTRAFPGGVAYIDVFGGIGQAMKIVLIVKDPSGTETPYDGNTDANTGFYNFTLPLEPTALPGLYTVTAFSYDLNSRVTSVFSVNILTLSASMVKPAVAPGEQINISVRLNFALSTMLQIDGVDYYWETDKTGSALLTLNVPETMKLGTYTLTIRDMSYNLSTTVKYTVAIPPTLKVSISPKQVAPGESFTINVLVQPGTVTKITLQGYDGSWQTNADGMLQIKMDVDKDAGAGEYQVVVQAPDLKLTGSDTYTVSLTPSLSGSINAVTAQLVISIEGSTEDEEFSGTLYLGSQYVRCNLDNYQIHASGRVAAGSIDADMSYDLTLDKSLTKVTSGSVSLRADNGATYSFTFSNLPRDTAAEAQLKADQGLDAIIFHVSGTAVSSYLGSVSVNDEAIGNISRYFTSDDSELTVILVAATDSQLTDLLGDY